VRRTSASSFVAVLAAVLASTLVGAPAEARSTSAAGVTGAVAGDRAADRAPADRKPRRGFLAPRKGTLFGVSIDWGNDTLAAYSERLGRTPAVAVTFTGFPMSEQEEMWLDQAVEQARTQGSELLLTVEPFTGLDAVTRANSRALAQRLAGYNRQGVDVYLRFAHEMNGSWYPWGQQPDDYVDAFRRMAVAVHAGAPRTAMMWAPNYGGGYPFVGGTYQAPPGRADAEDLDTDGDGTVTGEDDPYRPYWPGRKHVDWVGMSVYHWGAVYPWGENEVPEQGKYRDLLRGTYDGAAGDESAVPDFYAEYGAGMRLPVAVTETAALFVPDGGGADEESIKSAWWQQVMAPGNARAMPWLKMVNWFEWAKFEPEVDGRVDWTVTLDDEIREGFVQSLPRWLKFGGARS
jgi:hypothetical protein